MLKKLEQIRQQKHMSIKELCLRADIKERTYFNWKSNITSPDLKEFEKLCKVLKININISTYY